MALPVVVALLSTSFCLLISIFYAYRKFYCHKYFKRIGISGPEPHWLYGNAHELFNGKRVVMLRKWQSQYGDFFGYYEGSTPILVVSNPEAVEQICVKQFAHFQGHNIIPIQPDPRTDSKNSLFAVDVLFAWGAYWKKLRSNVSTCFSTGKLKGYMPLVNKSQAQFLALLDKKAKSGETFEIHEVLQRLTMDVIASVAFGTEINSLSEDNQGANVVLDTVKRGFSLLTNRPKLFDVITYVPEVAAPLKKMIKLQAHLFKGGAMGPYAEMGALSRQVVEQRVKDVASKKNDIIQVLIENSELADVDKNGKSNQSHEEDESKSPLEPLTLHEVISSTVVFFGAGTDTTATTLAFASYLLATNPGVQEKLHREIVEHFPGNENIEHLDYDTFMGMTYLDWVCKETLRIYPIGAFGLNRFVVDDTEVCGVPISKNLGSVLVNVCAIHNDPQLWGPVDPAKFYPERFSPEYSVNRPDAAFLAFGYGPRTCVGMRLALLELKSTLVKMLMRYRIVPPKEGYPSGLPVSTDGTISPRDGVLIRLMPRV